ncbi:hypothetical protein I6J32_09455 [Moraxella osloensis]|nr:hypothetical protein [Moraxella osloensis]QRO12834.1 hypothetical protein I6J32_09455 [Moraxella osloensis]
MTTALKTKVNQQDLKIYPSERLTQTDDGGGMPLGTPLTGALNELFQPISSIARVNGAFYAVLEYMGVLRPDDEPLIGAFAAITKPPSDPTVSYLMSKAGRFGESRAEALARIESFNTATTESRMTLLSTNYANSRVIQVYQRDSEALPLVGDVLCLKQAKAGYPNVYQYVQISRIVKAEKRTFTVGSNDFTRTVMQLEITSKLKTDFIGIAYPVEGYADAVCKVYDTAVSDAGVYYGIKPLAEAFAKDAATIKITGIMEKIIPVSTVEKALVDTLVSKKTVDIDVGYNGNSTIKQVSLYTHSYKEDITVANRGYTYTAQLLNPIKGSVKAEFLVQGTWYTLNDDGNGKLVGTSATYGSGTIDYTTGSVTVQCGELPDIGSALIISYSKNAYIKPTTPKFDAYLTVNLTKKGYGHTITVGSKTATVQGDKIVGDFGGMYDYDNQILKIEPTIDKADIVVSSKSLANAVTTESTGQASNGDVIITMSAPIVKGTLSLSLKFSRIDSNSELKIIDVPCHDDGLGNLIAYNKIIGTVNYSTGNATIAPKYQKIKSVTPVYKDVQVGTSRQYASNGTAVYTPIYESVYVRDDVVSEEYSFHYLKGASYLTTDGATQSETIAIPANLKIDVEKNLAADVLSFTIADKLYQEQNLNIMRDGAAVGSRADNIVTLTDFDMSKPVLQTLLVKNQGIDDRVKYLSFATPRLKNQSLKLNIDGNLVSSDPNGNLMLGGKNIGSVDAGRGIVMLNLVDFADSITWQGVAISYLPVDSNIVKIDTVRLPQDGRVPIFRRGDSILIRNAQTDNLGSAFTGGQTINLSRNDVDRISLLDADNKPVLGELWDYDLDAGTITFKPSIDLSSYKMPLKAIHAQEQRNRIVDLDIDGTLSLLFAANRNYPIEDTYVSSLQIGDDLAVRVSVPFTQRSWNNVWQDTPVGEQLLNKLKLTDYPMILTDDGAITDRWMIKFTSSSQFELYSEALGFVGKFDTLTDLAPINPATGKPYFTIDKRAFGTDTPWAVQDVIRFNTWGTLMPVWVLCAVQPNPNPPTGTDGFEQYLFGDTTEITA